MQHVEHVRLEQVKKMEEEFNGPSITTRAPILFGCFHGSEELVLSERTDIRKKVYITKFPYYKEIIYKKVVKVAYF